MSEQRNDLNTDLENRKLVQAEFERGVEQAFKTMHRTQQDFLSIDVTKESSDLEQIPSTEDMATKSRALFATYNDAKEGKIQLSTELQSLANSISELKESFYHAKEDVRFFLSKRILEREQLNTKVIRTTQSNKKWNVSDSQNLRSELAAKVELLEESKSQQASSENKCRELEKSIADIRGKLANKNTVCKRISWLDSKCVEELQNALSSKNEALKLEQANLERNINTNKAAFDAIETLLVNLLATEQALGQQIETLEARYRAKAQVEIDAAIKVSEANISQYLSELVGLQKSLQEQITSIAKRVEIANLEFDVVLDDISFKEVSSDDNTQQLSGETENFN